MRKALISSAVTAAVLIAIVAIIVGILQLVAASRHDDPQVLYSFATTAMRFQNDANETGLLAEFNELADEMAAAGPEDTEDIETAVWQGILTAQGYKEQFTWFSPTEDTLEVYTSLVEEGTLVVRCFSRLNAAWSEKAAGNEAGFTEGVAAAREAYDEAIALREQNRESLEAMLRQAEEDMAD